MKHKLDRETINELIKNEAAGSIFIGKLKECYKKQRELNDYQEFHELWIKDHEGTARNKTIAFLRMEVMKLDQEALDKEKKKWKELLRQHLGVKETVVYESDDLTEVKSVPIQDLVSLDKVHETGGKIVAICPFHAEKTGSFTIYPDTNSWYCYGCTEGGDNISFIQQYHSVGFREAINIIKPYGGTNY